MKFKMAEKSLFAILLRAPWWVSMLFVVLVVMVAAAVLPKPYVPFGVMAALPFFVISVVVAWRRLRAPDPVKVANILAQIASMSWDQFSKLVMDSLQAQGYAVTVLASGAADFKLEKSGNTVFVSCRRWKAGTHGIPPLKELLALVDAHESARAVYLSLGACTENALRFAKTHQIRLISADELGQLLLGRNSPQSVSL